MVACDYFLLNTETCWGVFLVAAPYYPKEFLDNISHVKYINQEENLEKYLVGEIGRNRLVKCNFDLHRDIGRIIYK